MNVNVKRAVHLSFPFLACIASMASVTCVACAAILDVDFEGKRRTSQTPAESAEGGADPASEGGQTGQASQDAGDESGFDRNWSTWWIHGLDAFPANYTPDGDVVCDNDTALCWPVSPFDTPVSWKDAEATCSNLRVGNSDRWRVPTRIELLSIVAFGFTPTFKSYFTGPATDYWTATPYVEDPSAAWSIDFARGQPYPAASAEAHHVRCVRGGRSTPNDAEHRFVVTSGSGTVIDTVTNLTWQRDSVPARSFLDARKYCQLLSINGIVDFEVPHMHELFTIVDDRRSNPALSPAFATSGGDRVWSMTPGDSTGNEYFTLDETMGGTSLVTATELAAVRCVHR